MAKDTYKTGDSPFINVESCGGELVIRGWAEPLVRIRGDHEITETEKGIQVSARGGLKLNIPEGSLLTVGQVASDLIVKHLTNHATIDTIQGDAIFSDTGEVQLGAVHGDLVARNLKKSLGVDEVHGDVAARNTADISFTSIYGDLSARKIQGNLTAEAISGDADLRLVEGDIAIAHSHRDVNLVGITGQANITGVKGDIRLRGGLQDGEHTFEAAGDIIIRWPDGLPLNLIASGGKIENRLPLEDAVEKNGNLVGHLGQGNTHLTVTTPGRLILRQAGSAEEKWETFDGNMEFEFDMDMAGMASRIETEMNSHLSRLSRDIESKFGGDFAQRMVERVAQKTDRMAERTRRRDFRGRPAGNDYSSGPAPTKQAASTEEQLKILKMVENGKITPQEASMLLEALEV